MTHPADTISFEMQKADEQAIRAHLQDCDKNFIPVLSEKVDLQEYAKKIFDKAKTFEAWQNGKLIGLIAAYFNNVQDSKGFITSVSVSEEQKGKGIAATLLKNCLEYAHDHHFSAISLEVSGQNKPAINLYKKFGFLEQSRKGGSVIMNISFEPSS